MYWAKAYGMTLTIILIVFNMVPPLAPVLYGRKTPAQGQGKGGHAGKEGKGSGGQGKGEQGKGGPGKGKGKGTASKFHECPWNTNHIPIIEVVRVSCSHDGARFKSGIADNSPPISMWPCTSMSMPVIH